MKILFSVSLLAMLLAGAVACGSSDDSEPGPSVETASPETQSRPGGRAPKILVSSRAVIELDISGMTSESDADDVRRTLEWLTGVEKAKVDFATGKAKVLMKAGVRKDDLPDAVEDLRDALSAPLKVTGFSWKFGSSTKLDW